VTVGEAIEGYLTDLRQRAETGAKRGKRSGYQAARRLLEKHVVPRLGKMRLRDLTSDQVTKLHRSLSKTPAEANRTLTALSAVLGYADRSELASGLPNVTKSVDRYREDGTRRALTDEELRRLGEAMHQAEASGTVNCSAILALRLMALTGFRRSEVVGSLMKARRGEREGLRWGDVDLDRGRITLRDSKAGPQVRTVGEPVLELLRKVKPERAKPSDPVCPGRVPGEPYFAIDKPRRRLFEAARIEGADAHSLRHTFASIGAHAQGGRFTGHLSPLLGHGHAVRRSVTARYISDDPENLEKLRPAADAIAGEIARLLGLGEPAKVLEFPAGRE
jgi:integrase